MFAVYAAEPNPERPSTRSSSASARARGAGRLGAGARSRPRSLNMHDLWTLRGVGIKAEQFPMILGCDGAGRFPTAPRSCCTRSSGTRRGSATRRSTRSATCSPRGTRARSPKRSWCPRATPCRMPAGLTAVQAAVMGTAWLTAYRMLFVKSGLRPGQTMLVQGASGGVSTALIQLGTRRGDAGVGDRAHRGEAGVAAELGAHATFESGARLPERVDAVFETVGEATWAHSMRALKPGGVIVVSGATSGPTPAPTCSGCSSCSCGSSARRWAPATSSPTCLDVRHERRDRPGDRARTADGAGRGGLPGDVRR